VVQSSEANTVYELIPNSVSRNILTVNAGSIYVDWGDHASFDRV